MSPQPITHPNTAEPARETLHGVEVDDPFRWLEEQESPPTRAFIETEQKSYDVYLSHHAELRSHIEGRVTELLTVPAIDLPVSDRCGGLIYLKREAQDEQKAIYHRNETGLERILVSTVTLGADFYTSLTIIQISPDGRFLVFGMRAGGEDVQQIGLFDLRERCHVSDRLPRGFYRGLVFDRQIRGFYYAHEEVSGRYQFRRSARWHELGTDQREDHEIFHAGDGPGIRLLVQGAEDGSALGYLVVSLESIPETRFLVHDFPLNQAPREVVHLSGASFAPRFTASSIEAITTDSAPRGRVVRISLENPENRSWRDIIPETDECLISWERWGTRRVVHYTVGGHKLTRIYSQSDDLCGTVEYPQTGTCLLGQVDEPSHSLFYSHSDIAEPPAIYAVDLVTGEHRLWWRQPSSVGNVPIATERLEFLSKNSAKIPITLVRPQGVSGPCPVLLSAYGGGGVSTTPKFSALVTVLLESGFICATAHVRGGGEGGPEWHLAAKKGHKQTSVDDLIAAAEWLVQKGYTTPARLVIAGQSEGALLTLCAMTQQPQLMRAAMALGPIADLTRFHNFGVARGFIAELGSPENPEEFAALYRLSPYHRIQPEIRYPAVLIISGDQDRRCDALHARKMIARLKSTASPCHPILLDYTRTRGHKPVLPLRERIRTLTNRLTFLIAETGNGPSEAQAL